MQGFGSPPAFHFDTNLRVLLCISQKNIRLKLTCQLLLCIWLICFWSNCNNNNNRIQATKIINLNKIRGSNSKNKRHTTTLLYHKIFKPLVYKKFLPSGPDSRQNCCHRQPFWFPTNLSKWLPGHVLSRPGKSRKFWWKGAQGIRP